MGTTINPTASPIASATPDPKTQPMTYTAENKDTWIKVLREHYPDIVGTGSDTDIDKIMDLGTLLHTSDIPLIAGDTYQLPPDADVKKVFDNHQNPFATHIALPPQDNIIDLTKANHPKPKLTLNAALSAHPDTPLGYKVAKGENLGAIIKKEYGITREDGAIYKAIQTQITIMNPKSDGTPRDPSSIFVGETLHLPSANDVQTMFLDSTKK